MEFSRPEYWSGLSFPSPGDLPNPEIELWSPTLQADSLPSDPRGEALYVEALTPSVTVFGHRAYEEMIKVK